MGWLSNVTVNAKAVGVFALVIVCVVGLGIFADNRLSAVNADAAEVRDNWLPSVGLIGTISTNVERYRVREGAHISSPSDADMAVEEKNMEIVLNKIASLLPEYQALLKPGEETNMYNRFTMIWNDYLALSRDQLLPASRRQDNAAASRLYRGESREKFSEIRQLLEKLSDFNIKGGKAAADHSERIYGVSKILILATVGLVVVLCLCAGWIIIATVSRPIQALTRVMDQLARHDLTVSVTGTGRQDEIGAMARAVQVFKEGLMEAERLAAIQVAEQQAKQRRTETIETLVHAFDNTAADALRTVAAAATEMDATAHSMADLARQTSTQATTVAGAAEQTSANVQTVAAATEQMTGSIGEISAQVARSTTIAAKAVEEATRTNETVRGLAEVVQRIGTVVSLITNIAGQTNLLALNATIEAARAGEAGKGFAVVASEVKNLATQTAKATKEIASQIADVQDATSGAVQAISGIGGTIGEMNAIAAAIAAAIEQQTATTGEISRNVQQAAAGTQEVSTSIGMVTHTTHETGAAADQVLSAASQLARQSDTLKSAIEHFLVSIKAA